jgi:hypothetical protein
MLGFREIVLTIVDWGEWQQLLVEDVAIFNWTDDGEESDAEWVWDDVIFGDGLSFMIFDDMFRDSVSSSL